MAKYHNLPEHCQMLSGEILKTINEYVSHTPMSYEDVITSLGTLFTCGVINSDHSVPDKILNMTAFFDNIKNQILENELIKHAQSD